MAHVQVLTARTDFSIPSEGQRTHLNEILNLNSLQGKYIQATVFKKWELLNTLKGHRMKVVLEESISNEIHQINLFLFGEYAVKFACVKEQHEVLIFNGKVEKSTTYMKDKLHPFAIHLKDGKPMPQVQVKPPAPSRPQNVTVSGKNTSTSTPSTIVNQNTSFKSPSVILHRITPPSTSKRATSRQALAITPNQGTSGVPSITPNRNSPSSTPKGTTSKGPSVVQKQKTSISTPVSASTVNASVKTPPIVSTDTPSTSCTSATSVNASVNTPPIVSTGMPSTSCTSATSVNASVNTPPIVSTGMPSTSCTSVTSVNASVNTPPIVFTCMPSTSCTTSASNVNASVNTPPIVSTGMPSTSCTSVTSVNASVNTPPIVSTGMPSTSCTTSASSVNASINTMLTVSEGDRSSTSKQIPKETPKSQSSVRNYTYTPLANIQEDMIVNVYGMVKFFKPPYRGRGPDYCMTIRIVDSSLDKDDKGLLCILFMKQKDSLPNVVTTGDIVRMHRLKIRIYNGYMQGGNFPGFSSLVFHGSGTDYRHRSTTPLYTFTDNDKIHVDKLRKWAQGDEISQEKQRTLSSIESGEYVDICVKVVATLAIPEENCIALKVWDGTLFKSSLRWVNVDDHDFEWDLELAEKAKGYLVDVWIYDDHVEAASKLKAGQFIKLFNLHAPPFRQADVLELVLHCGTSYGRGVMVIPEGDPAVVKMEESFSTADQRLKDSGINVGDLSLTKRKQLGFLNCNVPCPERAVESQKTLSSIKSREYFDICVQIVASVAIPEENCIAFKVWDGTLCKSPLRWVNVDDHEFEWDLELAEKAKGYLVDVWIYDDHVAAASKLKAGQFIKLFNLHAPPLKQADVLELVLHRGTSYGRGVKVIQESNTAVVKMKELFNTADQRLKQSGIKVEDLSLTQRKQLGFLNCNIQGPESEAVGDDNQEAICMQESATRHHDLAVSSIYNVLQISSPNLSKIRAKVISLDPKKIEDFVILSCPECGLRANAPTTSETNKARRKARKRLAMSLRQTRRRSSRIQKKLTGKGKKKLADMVDFIIYHTPENNSEKKKRDTSKQCNESKVHSMITRRKRKLLDEHNVETSVSLAKRGRINKGSKGSTEVQDPPTEQSVEKTKSSMKRGLRNKQGCDPSTKQNVDSSTIPSVRRGLRKKNVEKSPKEQNPPTEKTKSSVKRGCQKKNTKDSSKGQDPPKEKATARKSNISEGIPTTSQLQASRGETSRNRAVLSTRKSHVSEGIPTTSQLQTSCGETSRNTAVLSTRKSHISEENPTTSQLQTSRGETSGEAAVLSRTGVIEDFNGEQVKVRVAQSDDGKAGFTIIPLTTELAINDAFKLVRSGLRVKPSNKVYLSKNLNRPTYYECPRCHRSDNSQTVPLLQYQYNFQLKMYDGTEEIEVTVKSEDAVTFFNLEPPGNLHLMEKCLKLLEKRLKHICPHNISEVSEDILANAIQDETRPWLDCCIRGYYVRKGNKTIMRYQICDTTLVLDDTQW